MSKCRGSKRGKWKENGRQGELRLDEHRGWTESICVGRILCVLWSSTSVLSTSMKPLFFYSFILLSSQSKIIKLTQFLVFFSLSQLIIFWHWKPNMLIQFLAEKVDMKISKILTSFNKQTKNFLWLPELTSFHILSVPCYPGIFLSRCQT